MKYYLWRVFQRNGVYYADGRGCTPSLGKHSLCTKDPDEVMTSLQQLDAVMAKEHRHPDYREEDPSNSDKISISAGWEHFMQHATRAELAGGVSPGTQKRYRAVRQKHEQLCSLRNVTVWAQINKAEMNAYAALLEKNDYAPRSIYLELTTVKSVHKYLRLEKLLAEATRFHYPVNRPLGSETYCYKAVEVRAMLAHCQQSSNLGWMTEIVLVLALTGVRISELVSLKWTDIKYDDKGQAKTIILTDDRASSKKRAKDKQRRLKGKRGRSIPLAKQVVEILSRMSRHQDGRIFHGPNGGRLKPDTVRNVFIREVINPLESRFPSSKDEVGFKDGRLHGFRHFFVSQAFLRKVSENQIKDWVGHRDSRVIELYRHQHDQHSHETMQDIDLLND